MADKVSNSKLKTVDLETRVKNESLVDPGMIQVALAIAVIGFVFGSGNTSDSERVAWLFWGSGVVTLVLMLVYGLQWAARNLKAFSFFDDNDIVHTIMAALVASSNFALTGAVFFGLVISAKLVNPGVLVIFAFCGVPLVVLVVIIFVLASIKTSR